MAVWHRSRLLKIACGLGVLLIICYQLPIFRSKSAGNSKFSDISIRLSSDTNSNSMKLMRPNFKHATNNTSDRQSLTNLYAKNTNSSHDSADEQYAFADKVDSAKISDSVNTISSLSAPNSTINNKIYSGNDTDENDPNCMPLFAKIMHKLGLMSCPIQPPNLIGPIEVDTEYESLESVEAKFQGRLLEGGWYRPTKCAARDRVAIIVPYRDRASQLPIFLKNIHPFLMKQQIEYGIFIIEQTADYEFNRASLLNVGFIESLKLHKWDCMIFHDVDLLPLDDRNLYTCPDQPRHMSVAVDTFEFRLPYYSIFGGACAMTVRQFQTVNGFSNVFWGWGGEDDDMSNRLRYFGYHISRYSYNIARYKMLQHLKDKASPNRFEKLKLGMGLFKKEGLNTLKYRVHSIEKKVLYTRILVELKTKTLMSALAAFFTT